MKYTIVDSWILATPGSGNEGVLNRFRTKKECMTWLTEGLFGCEGAERDHYVDMMEQLNEGRTTLDYRRKG